MNEEDPNLSYRDVLQCCENRTENIKSRSNNYQRTPNKSQRNIKEISRK